MTEQQRHTTDDHITLQQVFTFIQDYLLHFWRKKWWIVGGALLMATYFVTRVFMTEPTYEGTMSFMVNQDESGSGGLSGLAAQFGIPNVGGGGNLNLIKLRTLSRSRRIAAEALFDSVGVVGNYDLVANHIIRLYDIHEDWKDTKRLRDFWFTHNQVDSFDETTNLAFKLLHLRLIGTEDDPPLMIMRTDEDSGVIRLTANTRAADVSYLILNEVYHALQDFYVKKAVEQQQLSVDRLEMKADSVRNALYAKERELARWSDRSLSLLLSEDNIKVKRLDRDIQILNVMYAETIRNLETATFLLENQTPIFQVIDKPLKPLTMRFPQWPISASQGLLFGAILALALLSMWKLWTDTMSKAQ